jgi:uncharacterized cupin superfamily protein
VVRAGRAFSSRAMSWRSLLAGTHSVSNASDDDVRCLMVSTTTLPDVVVYPETGATLVALDRDVLAFPNDTASPRLQVVEEAFRAAGGPPHTS